MGLADRYRARRNADGSWTVTVTRRFATAMGLGYRDESITYKSNHRPTSPGAAWQEGQRVERERHYAEIGPKRAHEEKSQRRLSQVAVLLLIVVVTIIMLIGYSSLADWSD